MSEERFNEERLNEEAFEPVNTIKHQQKTVKKPGRARKVFAAVGLGLAFGIVAGIGFVGTMKVANMILSNFHFSSSIDIFDNKDDKKTNGKPSQEKAEKKEKDDISESKATEEVKEKSHEIPSTKVVQAKDVAPDRSAVRGGMDVSDIVENCMPSIVSITNKSIQEVRSMFGGGIRQYESESAGSGIIVGQDDNEILIVTNNHVVEDANTLTVAFIDEEIYTANVKGTDPDLDLAILSVKIDELKDSTLDEIKVAVVGDSTALRVGEQVVAIGNAMGYGQSVTTGIVSALGRDQTDDGVDNPLIQTDAAINPGNSGGALLNIKGELVGINCAKIASTYIEGVGYAIPLDQATPIIEKLMNRVAREKVDEHDAGYIGISGISVDAKTSKAYGIPEGVYVQSVEDDSPAKEAGLIQTDVIKKFDGIAVSSITEIRDNLNYYKAGEVVELDIYRLVDGEYVEKTIEITLGSREGTSLDPDRQTEAEEAPQEETPEENLDDYSQFMIDPFSIFGY